MKKVSLLPLVALYFLAYAHSPVWGGQSGDIRGRVIDLQGNPVSGIEILAAYSDGQILGRSLTNGQGEYVVSDLEKGNYNLTLNPRSTGLKGQTVVAALDRRGLEVSWTASASAPAIATANVLPSPTPQVRSSAASSEAQIVEPTIMAAASPVTSPDSSTASSSIQLASAQGAMNTSGTTNNSGQQTEYSEEEERRRRNLFLGLLGFVGAGVGGAAGSGAFDSDDDLIISGSR